MSDDSRTRRSTLQVVAWTSSAATTAEAMNTTATPPFPSAGASPRGSALHAAVASASVTGQPISPCTA